MAGLETKRAWKREWRELWREPPPDLVAARLRFTTHAERWKKETCFLSSVHAICTHPSYQAIIGMGRQAIPFILEDMEKNHTADWFWALTAITEVNVISEKIAGDIEEMNRAWVRWGYTPQGLSWRRWESGNS